jgi:hypothetical protein
MWFIRKFLLKLTQEQIFPSVEDMETLSAFSKKQRRSLYKRLTQLSYTCNREQDRMGALFIRNQLMADTKSKVNEFEEEIQLRSRPSHFIPDALKDEA